MDTQFPPTAKPLSRRLIAGVVAAGIVVMVGAVIIGNAFSPRAVVAPKVAGATSQPTIQITKEGFMPARITVKAGSTVRWVNTTKAPHRVASNPYPERTDLPGLYADTPLAPDDSYEYTFERAGVWGYHDPGAPTMGGTVVVE